MQTRDGPLICRLNILIGNQTEDMDYVNQKIQKWMPNGQRVAVDSTPKLHGIFDTINSTFATEGSVTRLPLEFYDPKLRKIIDRIAVEEEFFGYKESKEYRMLGIGALLGEAVDRMKVRARDGSPSHSETSNPLEHDLQKDDGARMALFACHDATEAAILGSLGALEGENCAWPVYGSSIALELFKTVDEASQKRRSTGNILAKGLQLIRGRDDQVSPTSSTDQTDTGPEKPKAQTNRFYVRVKYNDRTVRLPGCSAQGLHLDGNDGFCTLVSLAWYFATSAAFTTSMRALTVDFRKHSKRS